jgi:hypothetical protein
VPQSVGVEETGHSLSCCSCHVWIATTALLAIALCRETQAGSSKSTRNIAHLALVSHRHNVILTPQDARLRWERLQALVETHLDLALCGVTHLTSTAFSVLWGKSCRGSNLLTYLTTLTDVYPEEFEWSVVRPGRGRSPPLFEIRMTPELIAQLTADEERAASAVTMASPSADALHPVASLVLAV